MTTETRDLVTALRTLHDRLAAQVVDLGPDQLRSQSFDTEWTVADVLSHLGSGAQLSLLRLREPGGDGPSPEDMAQVWATWDTRTPEQQAVEAVAVDGQLIEAFEQLDDAALDRVHRELAGIDLESADVLRLRLSEHAMHGWDIAVALDDTAVVPDVAVPVLLDLLPVILRLATQPHDESLRVRVTTTDPDTDYLLELRHSEARIERLPDGGDIEVDGELQLPAEALLRLVYGRLDPAHTPPVKASDDTLLDRLRSVFRGF